MSASFGLWEANVAKHAEGVNSLTNILGHISLESQQINSKIEYVESLQAQAKKKEDKLIVKRGKYDNEDSIRKWENDALLKEFGEEEVKKLLLTDPKGCLPLILPELKQNVDETRLMSAYLTECLITEIDRTHVDVGFKDLVAELKVFTNTIRDNLKESQQICE